MKCLEHLKKIFILYEILYLYFLLFYNRIRIIYISQLILHYFYEIKENNETFG